MELTNPIQVELISENMRELNEIYLQSDIIWVCINGQLSVKPLSPHTFDIICLKLSILYFKWLSVKIYKMMNFCP